MSTDRASSNGHGELLRQSLAAINSLEAEVESLRRELGENHAEDRFEPIAIVGAACRFPGGANDLDGYWRLLENGIDAVTSVPPARRALGGWTSGDPSRWRAGFVEDIEQFDPRFFGISAREAATMDPQQRLVLEVGWEALENAGYAPGALSGSSTGVFMGLTTGDYAQLIRESGTPPDFYIATGNAHNAAAGRLSFALGLQGPSIALDTACSSALVAVHLACLSLRARNCRMALAGGVNVLLSEQPFEYFHAWGMMAPDGKCKTFDASADGFVRSEGCGIVVLKRLSDALPDGDRILAIVRGSAVNQDGKSSGLTVPNGPAQEAVIRQALAAARAEPAEIGYIECHGTGTALGDPIEAHALATALGDGRSQENPLVVGSVKANLGHLESAAGIAGLLKAVLALDRECIPAQLHFRQLNPQIDWAGTPVEIPVQARSWPRGQKPRLAGVSSFGFSGTNAHLILEEAPTQQNRPAIPDRPLHVVTLSARTAEALEGTMARMRDSLKTNAESLPDVAWTANTGRTHFRERAAAVAGDTRGLLEKLSAGKVFRGVERTVAGKLAFLFTGQGSQWAGMCRELYQTQPLFRDSLDECAGRLQLAPSLLDVIYGSDGALLEQTAYTQPALFAIEWSLAQLWKSWGIEPDVVFGHSVGEYAALCVAGVWTLADGLRLIAERARLMQDLGPGWGMTAAQAAPEKTEDLLRGLEDFVSIAARNAPAGTVVSGRLPELVLVEKRLAAAGVKSMRLPVSHGFHSRQMEQAAQEFARIAQSVEARPPRCRIVSSVTGAFTDRDELGEADYWRRQIRNTVQFQAGMTTLAAAGYDIFLEVGPAPTLCGLGKQCIGAEGPLWVPSIRRERGAWEQILDSLAQLYVRGAQINWSGFDAPYDRRRVSLPTYPFERQRCWVESAPASKPASGGHPLLGTRFAVAGTPELHVWNNEITTAALPYLEDYRVQGTAIFPPAAYIEMTAAAAREIYGDVPIAIAGIEYRKPLFLTGGAPVRLQLSLSPVDGRVRIHAANGDSRQWTLCSQSTVRPAEPPTGMVRPSNFEALAERQISGDEFYALFAKRGNLWGPSFQGMRQAWLAKDEGWSEIEVPEPLRLSIDRYCFHPAVGDACAHVLAAIASSKISSNSGGFVGQAIEHVYICNRPRSARLTVHARLASTSDPALFRGDVEVFNEDGSLVSHLQGAQIGYLDRQPGGVSDWFYQLAWKEATSDTDAVSDVDEWLILAGQNAELADALARRMRASNATCTVITNRSLSELPEPQAPGKVTGVVCLGGLDAHEPADESAAMSDETERLLQVVKSMAGKPAARLWVVTQGLEAVGNPPADGAIWQAPLRGLVRSVAVEYPELRSVRIDLDPAGSPEQNADALWNHLRSPGDEDQVAVRAGRRFVARLERCRVPETAGMTLREDCAYLITGGLGGLGLAVARWMVQRGARRLLLIGRTPLPDRSTWRELPADHAQAAQVRAIRDLETSGASVHLAFLDVSDSRAVNQFFSGYAKACWPPIRGVVHAAGILEPHLLADLTPSQLDRSLRAKMGAWALDRALQNEPLDFFLMFSSAAALLSAPRLGAYAAANSFLDALARHRQARGQSALSINWGVWGEAGMASRFDAGTIRELAERGLGSMSTEQGLDALERLMQQPIANAAVLPVDWKKWSELYPAYTASPLLSSLLQNRRASGEPFGGHTLRQPGSHDELTAWLAGALAAVLGFNPSDLDPGLPINSFGLDSLTALEFRHRIESGLGVKISTVRLLQGPPIVELAEELRPLIKEQSAAGPAPELNNDAALLARVNDLTDAELDAALADLLNEDAQPL